MKTLFAAFIRIVLAGTLASLAGCVGGPAEIGQDNQAEDGIPEPPPPFLDPEFYSNYHDLDNCLAYVDASLAACQQACATPGHGGYSGPGTCLQACRSSHNSDADSCHEAFDTEGGGGGGSSGGGGGAGSCGSCLVDASGECWCGGFDV